MSAVRVGVLALQGSFREHMALLQKCGVEVVEVRSKEELDSVAGLIIPGGESTTMALVAERWGLISELQAFAKAGKPIWGTCAGMIFLADRAEGGCVSPRSCTMPWWAMQAHALAFHASLPQPACTPCRPAGQKKGGQALLGGLDIKVSRNFFGAQVRAHARHLTSCPGAAPGLGMPCLLGIWGP